MHLAPQYERLARFVISEEEDRAFPREPYFVEAPLRDDELSTRKEFVGENGKIVFPQTGQFDFLYDDRRKKKPTIAERDRWYREQELREQARIEAKISIYAMREAIERLIKNLEWKSRSSHACSSISGRHEWSGPRIHSYYFGETSRPAPQAKCKICHVRFSDKPLTPKMLARFQNRCDHKWDHLVYAPGEDEIAADAKCLICRAKYKHP